MVKTVRKPGAKPLGERGTEVHREGTRGILPLAQKLQTTFGIPPTTPGGP